MRKKSRPMLVRTLQLVNILNGVLIGWLFGYFLKYELPKIVRTYAKHQQARHRKPRQHQHHQHRRPLHHV